MITMDVKTENTIKRLEQQLSKVTDPKLQAELKSKINALKGNKEILK